MTDTPGERAKALAQSASSQFRRGRIRSARQKLRQVVDLKNEVERYSGHALARNHHDFTSAMLDMAELSYKLGKFKQGNQLAERAQAWADDPNCSSQVNFDRSFSVRLNRFDHFLKGLAGWLRAALPV